MAERRRCEHEWDGRHLGITHRCRYKVGHKCPHACRYICNETDPVDLGEKP